MERLNLAVIFGGRSNEYEISCVSAANVMDAIDGEKYILHKIGITKDGKWWYYNGDIDSIRSLQWDKNTEALVPTVISPCVVQHGLFLFNKAEKTFSTLRIDVAFPVMHGKNGEDGTIQGLLQLAGIPFIGCKTASSAVCMDKNYAKTLVAAAGIPVVPALTVRRGNDINIDELSAIIKKSFGYPVFVKPANAGSSVGISRVAAEEELSNAINMAFETDEKLLIEKSIVGKEVELAVLGNVNPVVSVCGEIYTDNGFYDYSTKYQSEEAQYFIPARISEAVAEKLRGAAALVYKTLDCSGLSRVDFFVVGEQYYFNEINTIPGFTPISMYPRLLKHSGYTSAALIDALVATCEVDNDNV